MQPKTECPSVWGTNYQFDSLRPTERVLIVSRWSISTDDIAKWLSVDKFGDDVWLHFSADADANDAGEVRMTLLAIHAQNEQSLSDVRHQLHQSYQSQWSKPFPSPLLFLSSSTPSLPLNPHPSPPFPPLSTSLLFLFLSFPSTPFP